MDDRLVLDANAVAGELVELFGAEMTVVAQRCAHCGTEGRIGGLRAWTHGPGTVLRCTACDEVVIRWSRTPRGVRVDVRGAAYLELPLTPRG
jgi:Family of unknown function (DUF6510)